MNDEIAVLGAMVTPAVLLLANANSILSTNQRLQAILDRVRETELTLAGKDAAPETNDPAVATAFFGCASLLNGAALLITETWRGIRATDRRFEAMMDIGREMAHGRS